MANSNPATKIDDSPAIRRQIFIIWLTLLVGSILILFAFDRYSSRLVDYLESKNPRIFIEKARKLATEAKYTEAIDEVNRAIGISPTDSSLYIMLGDYYMRKNDLKESLTAFEKAKQLNPNDYLAYFLMGEVKRKLRQLPESVADLQQAAKHNKDDRWLYNELGWAAYENNQLDVAYEAWAQANRLVPNEPMYYYDLALIHNKRQEWTQALEMYQKVITLDSTQTIAYDLAAEALLQSGNDELAAKYWNQVLEGNPKSVTALRGLGRVEMHHQQWPKALSYLEQAKNLQPDNIAVLTDLMTAYRNSGNKTKADQIDRDIKKRNQSSAPPS